MNVLDGHVLLPQVPGRRDRALHRVDRARAWPRAATRWTWCCPHHPELRARRDEPVRFFPYRYAPRDDWSLWGYAQSLEADVRVRPRRLPPAAAGGAGAARARWPRGCASARYDVVHAHWVVPNAALVADIVRAARRAAGGEPARQRRVPGRAPARPRAALARRALRGRRAP